MRIGGIGLRCSKFWGRRGIAIAIMRAAIHSRAEILAYVPVESPRIGVTDPT
jgi:hypothetical protein